MFTYQTIILILGMPVLLFGLVLVLQPGAINRLNQPLRQALPKLDIYIKVERYYYRHHRFTGPLTLVGGVLLCFVGWMLLQVREKLSETMLLDAAVVILALFGIWIAVLGFIVTLRPSALKPFESWANQPVTRDILFAPLHALRGLLAGSTSRYPRLAGLVALLTGLILILSAL